jgi:hypothetical protein
MAPLAVVPRCSGPGPFAALWQSISSRLSHLACPQDAVILWAHMQYGNKWASIAKHLPGR